MMQYTTLLPQRPPNVDVMWQLLNDPVCKCKSLHSQMQDIFKSGGCRRLLPLAKTSQMELCCSRHWSITQTPSAYHTNISRNYMSNLAYLNKSASTTSSESLQPPFRLPRMKTICSPQTQTQPVPVLKKHLAPDGPVALASTGSDMHGKQAHCCLCHEGIHLAGILLPERRDSLDGMCDRSILVAHIASLHV
jgi:hypothetical protein